MIETKEILAIVGSTYDITGIACCNAIMGDSNPSHIYGNSGGAGRNIAENIARMGLGVSIISAYGDDPFSKELLDTNKKVGMDCSHCYIKEGGSACKYVSLLDQNGELLLAAADLDLLENIPVRFFQNEADYIGKFPYVFIDTNFKEDVLTAIANAAKGRIFADTVSAYKSKRLYPILERIDTLKTNRGELACLSGHPTESIEEIHLAAEALVRLGVKRVFVTMGPEGSCVCTKDEFYYKPSLAADVKNVTGAGDAFAAATLYGTVSGLSNHDTLILGTAASRITIMSPNAVSGEMNQENLLTVYRELKNKL